MPDPSGRKDAHGQLMPLGTRIEVDPDEAKVIQTIFEWAAEGVGLTTIVERLNAKGIWDLMREHQAHSRTSILLMFV